MKLWDVNGTIKCGHRLYNVQKFIVAETYSDAITMYQKEHPHAKCIKTYYKYDVAQPVDPTIIFTNLTKKA